MPEEKKDAGYVEANELNPLTEALHGLQKNVLPYLRSLPGDEGGYLTIKAAALRKLIVERIAKQL
jgi:hypothetical protein